MGQTYAKYRALESPETLATVIHAIIRQQYGNAAYEWDPLTIMLEVRDDFNAEMSATAIDRFSAIQVVMLNNAFFKRVDAFMGICNTLSSGEPFFQLFDPVTVEEAAWAIVEVSLNREVLPFSYPIKRYLKMMLKQDGYSDGNYPTPYNEIFGEKPKAIDIRRGLAELNNKNEVESYIDEKLTDMVYQFNEIPDLKDLDNIILQRSMEEFIGPQAEAEKVT